MGRQWLGQWAARNFRSNAQAAQPLAAISLQQFQSNQR